MFGDMSKRIKSKNTKGSTEVMLSVPNKSEKSAKFVQNETKKGVKFDRNGKKIAQDKTTSKSKKLSQKKLIIIIVAIILGVAAIAGTVAAILSSTNHGSQDETDSGIVEEEEPPEPLENKDPLADEPKDVDPDNYQVAAYKPRFISIPSLGLSKIPVTEVGWVNGNQLGSPKSTRVAGWFYRSAIPGERGAAIINAHGGDLGTGIFKTLPKIKMGDEVIIEMGDGRKFTYVVGEIAFKALGEEANKYMNTAFKSLVPGVPSLTLITCTGNWLKAQQTYDQRLYVRASMK